MTTNYYLDIFMGVCRSQNWEMIEQLYLLQSTKTLGNILKETIILLALSNLHLDKSIKDWAQRLTFNLSH